MATGDHSKENQANEKWLPLLNYSSKHNVSLSTLRRRIKAHSIQFKLDQGKYFIMDEPAAPKAVAVHRAPAIENHAPKIAEGSRTTREERAHDPEFSPSSFVEASVLSSANRLVEEIKAAYAKILQEKEEQIAQFKEEVADLRMLVRILEEGPRKQERSFDAPPENKKPSVRQESQPEGSSNEDFFFSDFQSREI